MRLYTFRGRLVRDGLHAIVFKKGMILLKSVLQLLLLSSLISITSSSTSNSALHLHLHLHNSHTTTITMPTISITAISDPVCPWCYIGALRLARAVSLYRKTVSSSDVVATTWHAYQLDPRAKPQPLLEKMADGDKVKARLEGIARREGFRFDFGGVVGSTRDAHRLEKLAGERDGEEEDLQTRVALEVMRMYFEQGGDITSVDDLAKAAGRVGIDEGEARAWLESDAGGEEVDAEVLEMQRLGIEGVPRYIINGKFTVDGAEDVGVFLEQMVLAREEALNESQ